MKTLMKNSHVKLFKNEERQNSYLRGNIITMRKALLLAATVLAGAIVFTCSCTTSFTQYVNPLIGSGGHGHVFVGASVPFGMVQAGPVQFNTGWDWCSGYHYSDSTIIGFAQMHLSGTGIGDLGDISLMPVAGEVETTRNG